MKIAQFIQKLTNQKLAVYGGHVLTDREETSNLYIEDLP
jgi:hypothetical protein